MENEGRVNFGSKLGIILATAGSAVGLGNVWRFPFMTGQNGGAAFILVYLACVFLLGIPGMISEFIVGRHAQANAARSYLKMGGRTPMAITGYIGVFTSMIILGFYSVVAGWCLQYLFASAFGHLQGDANYVATYFKSFVTNPLKPAIWTVVFILITHVVVAKGIQKGIEKASKLFMPMLFILLVVIVIASCMLPGAMKGIDFLFHPDFTKVNSNVFLEALGQAFFSLSLGTACLCTYASYFTKKTNLTSSAIQVAVIDTIIAILAGLMIFPAAFSVGVNPDSGAPLIFITLPNVFQQAFSAAPAVGYVIAILFYILLALAALTSTISMHEIGTAFFSEELKLSRKRAAIIVTVICCVIGVLCSLSEEGSNGLTLFGKSLMDCCDFFTAQILLPLGSLLTCIMVGWYVPRKIVLDEFTNNGTLRATFFRIYLFAVRYVCPACIILIFLHQYKVI